MPRSTAGSVLELPPVRARRSLRWALCVLPLLVTACGASPSPSAASSPRGAASVPARAWPTTAQAATCATSSPSQWMQCLVKAHPAFGRVPLSDMALPGAENAGTFNLDAEAFDNQVGSACATFDPGASISASKAVRFSATQDETIVKQLNGGVRWIDLQVGYNGGGDAVGGWRVTQNLYSSWPLSEYLDQVATWAAFHPGEAVVVDLSTICYDHSPTPAVDRGLWANFATKSVEGAGPYTLADVAAPASSFGGSPARATLADLDHTRRNVVVLIPSGAKDWQVLRDTYHVDPVLTTASGRGGSGTVEVEHSDPRVAPTVPQEFPQANTGLAAFPTKADPPLGSLQGRGFYVAKLAYELKGASAANQSAILSYFPGLVTTQGIFEAWMAGLWNGAYPQILTTWGSRTNVVLADGVDLGGFVPAVIERNGR